MKKNDEYLPYFLAVLYAFLLLNLWYLSAIAIEHKVLPIAWDYLFKGLTILIGAFTGAFSAFKLNSKKDENKRYKEQKMLMNKVLFISIRQINAIQCYCGNISKYSSDFERAFHLPALKPPTYADLNYNFNELSFLFEDHSQLMMNLAIEQERFEQTFDSITLRNDFLVNDVQPMLSELKLSKPNKVTDEFRAALGDRLYCGAITHARNMYYHLEEANTSINKMHEEIYIVASKIFPGESFIKEEPKI